MTKWTKGYFVSVFADDTRVTKNFKEAEDIEKLHDDITRVYKWQEQNSMLFNAKKFELFRHGKNYALKSSIYPKPSGIDIIEEKYVITDLGVKMNNNADFSDHINKVCSKTSQKSGWVLRTFSCRSTQFMKTTWKTLTQGQIDYASQLYQPLQSDNLTRIENLFKTFTKRIPEVGWGLSGGYWAVFKFELPACYHLNLCIFWGVWLFQIFFCQK